VAGVLRGGVDAWARRMTLEMGKPIREARAEVLKSAWVCEHYAEHGARILAPRDVASSDDVSYVRYDPLGPLLGIMPWNFPFWQVFRFAAPAVMAGNVALLKHASNVPGCALDLERVFREAGAPEGLFTTLLISGPIAERIVADPRVACVTLTGSEAAGRRVGAAAGASLKPSVLELGGSDPFVVLADADVARAARVAADARCLNSGQSCIAAKRFVVVRAVHDAFVQHFRAALAAKRLGDPLDEATDVGPLARPDLRDELHDQVAASVAEGATLVLGGVVPTGPGCFYPVTLLTGVRPEHTVARQETFGPVAAVLAVADDDQAVRLANATPFGLGASLWTRDLDRARRLVERIDAGAVFVNGLVKSDPRLPFGGVKTSGYGRELAEEGLRAFTNVKTVVMTRP
jgi:succinate-semialdehyde dehydrogenase/glutarate-semialdehyde dehydrogenase